jgi:N-acyl-D-aspartate/D-glutamate deacylase
MPPHAADIVFRHALVFTGRNTAPTRADVAVHEGRISAIAPDLSAVPATRSIDASGLWLLPGLLDVHTHLDLEVELAPGLPEVVRHGTTTVIMSNCSLGVAYGHQRRNGEDPITACFARVENIPKPVLRKVADACTWRSSAEYLEHFKHLALGANVVAMVPHSMLRVEVMGLTGSVTREPTEAEMTRMQALLEAGMQEGFAGFSTDALPFHFLANQPHTAKRIPTQFGSYAELKALTHIVRRHGRVWQATPPKDSPLKILRNFLLSSGRLHGRPLKITAVAALDVHTNAGIAKLGRVLLALLNSRLVDGRFNLQALAAPFKVWSDGLINPLSEEVPALRAANELDLDDTAGRQRLYANADWVRAFRRMWFEGKSGFNLANLMRLMKREHNVLNRRLDEMYIESCPLPAWNGQSLDAPYQRLVQWQRAEQGAPADATTQEHSFFASFPNPIGDDANFFIHLLRQWDTALRWHTTVANRDPAVLKALLFHPLTLPGFTDSGAHVGNLAFFDGNLRTLKIAQEDGVEKVALAVHRLTQMPAQFFNLPAGELRLGAQADLCLIDPQALQRWDPEASYRYIHREIFDCQQIVNRPEGVVALTMIAGHVAWQHGEFTATFGQQKMGRLLRPLDHPLEQAA